MSEASFRPDEALVGLLAAAIIPWTAWLLRRGLRDGWLPLSRTRVRRVERPAAFWTLFACYAVAAAMMVAVSLDLLFGIEVRIWL